MSIFDKIQNDNVLQEELDAVATVYPEFANIVQEQLAEQLIKKPKLDSAKTRTLKKVIGAKADYVADIQQHFLGNQPGEEDLNMQNNTGTEVTELEHR
jgi:hypothetical protein